MARRLNGAEWLLRLNPWRGLRGLPAEVWVIFATTLVNRAGTMVLPFLVLYLSQHLHYGVRSAGFALTVYGLGGLITAPLAGRLCDRVGALRVMQLSLFGSGALLLVLPLAHRLTAVFALIFVWAIIADASRPASMAALTGAIPASQRKAAIALNRLAINLGMSIGPALGGFLAAVSFPLLFVIDGVTSVAAAALLTLLLWRLRLPVRVRRPADPAVPPARRASAAALRDRRMLVFLAASLLVGAIFRQVDATMAIFLVRDLALPVTFFGLLFVVNTLLIVLLEVPLNVATAAWAHRHTLVLGAMLIATGFGAMAFAHSAWSVTGTVVVWTFGEMIFFPVSAMYVAELAPPERLGEYMGVYFMIVALAVMIGPWVGTLVMEQFGVVTLWSAVFVCGCLAALILGLSTPAAQPSTDAHERARGAAI